MYFEFGDPPRLSSLSLTCPELQELKKRVTIAVIDDQPFLMVEGLRTHGFNIVEMGGDIRSIDQVMAFPIIICDIKGVGKTFGSTYEGAHVLSEIRKTYPDKFLITYSGMQYDVSYNEILISADASATKDANIDYWISVLEAGLKAVGDPKERWFRFRNSLVSKQIDAYELFKLETAFVKSITSKNTSAMSNHVVPDSLKEIVKAFASAALSQIIEAIGK